MIVCVTCAFERAKIGVRVTVNALAEIMGEVGERLVVKDKDSGHPCTIRYVGAIDGKAGEWIGVEWDDQARGKNDGSVDGKSYFICVSAARSGSFIRKEKVHPGISLVDAVRDRYTLADADMKDMSIQTANRRTMAVNFSGMDQMSQHLKNLSLIRTMTMHGAAIARGVRAPLKAGSWKSRR
jgi:tubulin-specific chaperone E